MPQCWVRNFRTSRNMFKIQISTQAVKNNLRKNAANGKVYVWEKWVWSFETLNSNLAVRLAVLGKFAIFCSLFLKKVAGLRPANFLIKTLAQVLSCGFCQISKNTFFTENLWAITSLDASIFEPLTAVHFWKLYWNKN